MADGMFLGSQVREKLKKNTMLDLQKWFERLCRAPNTICKRPSLLSSTSRLSPPWGKCINSTCTYLQWKWPDLYFFLSPHNFPQMDQVLKSWHDLIVISNIFCTNTKEGKHTETTRALALVISLDTAKLEGKSRKLPLAFFSVPPCSP